MQNEEHRDIFPMGNKMTIRIDVEGLSEFKEPNCWDYHKSHSDQWIASINSGMNSIFMNKKRNEREQATLLPAFTLNA